MDFLSDKGRLPHHDYYRSFNGDGSSSSFGRVPITAAKREFMPPKNLTPEQENEKEKL
jgi:hypothetical protein